ncbi:MAG: metal-dependent transcriptional regulator [Nitrospinota bacterium]
MLSKPLENYLKSIWTLQRDHGPVSTSHVAESLEVSPASVTSMLKKLHDMKLVNYLPYKGATLTPRGEKVALEILRHHRLLELYLSEVIGLSWDRVHEEAEELEHALSEELEAILFEKLGNPTRDPHGDPIPTKDGRMVTDGTNLLDARAGESFVVIRVRDRDPEILRYLEKLGLLPGVEITVLEKLPFDGPLRVQVGAVEHTLGQKVSKEIFVSESG